VVQNTSPGRVTKNDPAAAEFNSRRPELKQALSVGLDVISAEVDVSSNRRTLIVLAQPLEQ
jgi:hypothetical protein